MTISYANADFKNYTRLRPSPLIREGKIALRRLENGIITRANTNYVKTSNNLKPMKIGVDIRAIQNPTLSLRKYIPIVMSFDRDDGFLASFDEASIAISGESFFDAFSAIRSLIQETFLEMLDAPKLGPFAETQFQVLEKYLEQRR